MQSPEQGVRGAAQARLPPPLAGELRIGDALARAEGICGEEPAEFVLDLEALDRGLSRVTFRGVDARGEPVTAGEVYATAAQGVQLSARAGKIEADGRFRIEGLAPGGVWLHAWPTSPGAGQPDRVLVEAPDRSVRIVCPDAFALRGKLEGEGAGDFKLVWLRRPPKGVHYGVQLFVKVEADGSFVVDVLPGMILLGVGAGIAFNPVLLAAMGDVEPSDAGLASGVVNTSFMMGGALGLAVLASLAASRTDTLLASGEGAVEALNGGYRVAFLAGAAFAALAATIGGALLRPRTVAEAGGHGEAVGAPATAAD